MARTIGDAARKSGWAGIAIAIAASVVFGAHAPAERGVFAAGGSVALVAIVTTWARAALLVFYCLARRQPMFRTRADTLQALTGGAFQALSVFCIFAALRTLPAPVAMIITFTHTLMLLFFMAWRGETKLDAVTVAATVAALLGLSLVIDLWNAEQVKDWAGIGFAFLSALATVSRLYVYGRQTRERPPAVVGAENFIFAALLTSVAALAMPVHMPQTQAGYGLLAVASLSLAAGSFLMFFGISRLGSFRYSLFSKLEPVFTSLFSVWFLGEILRPGQYIGIAVVAGSLAFYQIARPRGAA